jgi:hypothetical protein
MPREMLQDSRLVALEMLVCVGLYFNGSDLAIAFNKKIGPTFFGNIPACFTRANEKLCFWRINRRSPASCRELNNKFLLSFNHGNLGKKASNQTLRDKAMKSFFPRVFIFFSTSFRKFCFCTYIKYHVSRSGESNAVPLSYFVHLYYSAQCTIVVFPYRDTEVLDNHKATSTEQNK